MDDFERQICAKTQYLYSIETFLYVLTGLKKFLRNFQFNDHSLPVTPFNRPPPFVSFWEGNRENNLNVVLF